MYKRIMIILFLSGSWSVAADNPPAAPPEGAGVLVAPAPAINAGEEGVPAGAGVAVGAHDALHVGGAGTFELIIVNESDDELVYQIFDVNGDGSRGQTLFSGTAGPRDFSRVHPLTAEPILIYYGRPASLNPRHQHLEIIPMALTGNTEIYI